jgi:dGTPase
MRTAYQRDRDRIIHATAFRRLTYKTQVFLFHEGDHYRTRLTHSLEVAQIARAIARMLALDEDLAEAVALAHDLGHPPFGHAGERALAEVTAAYGGFDHNAQSLKVVTQLERKYAAFDGLNLTFETLEGLAKHNGPLTGGGGQRLLLKAVTEAGLAQNLHLDQHAPAEARQPPSPTISPTPVTISTMACAPGSSILKASPRCRWPVASCRRRPKRRWIAAA